MRKKKMSMSGVGIFAALLGILVVVVIVLIIVDVTRTPPATPAETCTLVHHIVLPDDCVCSKAGKNCTPTATRPYLVFWQQAAACPTLACDVVLH